VKDPLVNQRKKKPEMFMGRSRRTVQGTIPKSVRSYLLGEKNNLPGEKSNHSNLGVLVKQ